MESDFSTDNMEIDDARLLLAQADDMQAAARQELQSHGWQWFLVWAGVCFGAAISGLTQIASWYWLVAVPVGVGLTVGVSINQERQSGVQRRAGPYWAIGGAITILNFGARAFLSVEAMVVFIWVVFGLGFAAFAWIERQPLAAMLFAGLAVGIAVAGFVVPDTFVLYVVVGFIYAASMIGMAAGIRSMAVRR